MSTEYKPISELEKSEVAVSLDDLILISHPIGSGGTENRYKSNKTEVRNFVGTLSSEVVEPLSVEILKPLKKLAFMDPDQLNTDPDITAFVKKDTNIIRTEGFSAISAIHWTEGIIDRVESVSLDDVKAKVTDINTSGDPIAKIDGTLIYNGLSVEQVTKQGFEIAKINGTSIYGGQDNTTVQSITSKGNDIAKVIKTSPDGLTTYTIKNGLEVVPTNAEGYTSQVGQEIFKVNDIPVYNNLSVTSLVSNKNTLSDPIADINGNKIYNGIVLQNVSNIGQTIATINGTAIKNGVNINPSDFKNTININDNLQGTVIASIDGKSLKNGVNVDTVYDTKTGVKIANIAGTDIYAPGTDISVIATTGTKIADVKTATGKLVGLFSGEHPHVHLTLAEYDTLKKNNKLDSNTYYFTEGRLGDTGYDEVGVVYRYKSTTDLSGCYSWFELWPDGWCIQGGKIPAPSYTYNVKFLVTMANTDYNVNANAEMSKNYGSTGTCAHFNPIANTYTVNGFTMLTCGHFSHTFWEVKGYYDTSKLNDILKTYSTYTTTQIGITNVKQSIVGGNAVVGLIVAYGGTDTPSGWLLCDGTAVDKTTYAELYAVIGDKFGTSKDTTKFILPKLTDSRYLQGYVTPGTPYSDGLPNITGTFGNCEEQSSLFYGAFKSIKTTGGAAPNGMNGCGYNVEFDASKSNSIYGAATSVRPKSLTVRYLICWKATDAGNGGGVIDGTLCKDKVIMSTAATATKLEYIVDNDCLLVIENIGTDFTNYGAGVYVNGSLVASLIDQFGGTYTNDRVLCLIPVKKGSLITLQDIDDPTKKIWTAAATIAFYEYLLKSMNPLIAMPDWNNEFSIIDKVCSTISTQSYKVEDNGYIRFCFARTGGTQMTPLDIFCYINDKLFNIHDRNDSVITGRFMVVPVSKGDTVRCNVDIRKITDPAFLVYFAPCKPVPQKDCASYVVSTWRSIDKLSWCRIYSDGWCEQGGKQKTESANNIQEITLHLAYTDTNYTIVATPCGTDLGDNEHQGIYIKSPYLITTSKFYYRNDLEKGEYVMWETKGYINN